MFKNNFRQAALILTSIIVAGLPLLPQARAEDSISSAPYLDRWNFINRIHAEIFKYTVYDHNVVDMSGVVNYWALRYNPDQGVACRDIVEAFLLAHPFREMASQSSVANGNYGVTSGAGAFLFQYIRMQYRALVPGVDWMGVFAVFTWKTNDQINMTQLDAIFLDHPVFIEQCQAAGMEYRRKPVYRFLGIN